MSGVVSIPLQGYLAHNETTPQGPTAGLFLGHHDCPRGVGAFFYKRSTPVPETPDAYKTELSDRPLPSEYGTYKTVKARNWPRLSGESPPNLLGCFYLARKRTIGLLARTEEPRS